MRPELRVDSFKSVLVFILSIVLFFVVASVLSAIILHGGITPARLRISTVIQDIVLFVFPAIVTALVVTRYPARLLAVDRAPSLPLSLIALAALFASIPFFNMVVAWNEAVQLPESIAAPMKAAEENAAELSKLLMSGTTVGSLIVSVLIVGVLAGFSEELFFRGTLQRLLTSGKGAPHLAIWVTAFIFSAIHFQFYGFVPRLLLGAFFGYCLYWTGSVWVPVILHVVNNSSVVVNTWLIDRGTVSTDLGDEFSTASDWPYALVSLALTVGLIYLLRRESQKKSIK